MFVSIISRTQKSNTMEIKTDQAQGYHIIYQSTKYLEIQVLCASHIVILPYVQSLHARNYMNVGYKLRRYNYSDIYVIRKVKFVLKPEASLDHKLCVVPSGYNSTQKRNIRLSILTNVSTHDFRDMKSCANKFLKNSSSRFHILLSHN